MLFNNNTQQYIGILIIIRTSSASFDIYWYIWSFSWKTLQNFNWDLTEILVSFWLAKWWDLGNLTSQKLAESLADISTRSQNLGNQRLTENLGDVSS